MFAVVYPGERTLHLACSEIGPGLFIQHGFATIVAARRVGRNCWINQQVTIGFTRPDDRPSIGDDVFVYAGAKVLGDVTVGNGAVIGGATRWCSKTSRPAPPRSACRRGSCRRKRSGPPGS